MTQEEKKLPDGLAEAAEEYAYGGIPNGMKSALKPIADEVVKNFIAGSEWQKAKMLKLIETRISEIIGDAQPSPVLRMELQGIIDKIKIVFNV